MPVISYIRDEKSINNTLIVSPPGEGKTTMLRDIIRILSDGADGACSFKIGVVDERSEIGASYMGVVQNDLGKRCDVLDGIAKTQGMKMILRSMSPQIIAVDELGNDEDYKAAQEIMNSGIRLLGTIHARNLDEVFSKDALPKFDRYILVKRDRDNKRIYEVYDVEGNRYA